MPDRNYSSSAGGRQDRTQHGRWDERDEDDNRYGREDDGGRFGESRDYDAGRHGESGQRGSSGRGMGGGQRSSEYSRYGDYRNRDYPQTSSGYGGQSNYGQPSYGREAGSSGTSSYGRSDYGSRGYGGVGESNYGSGRYEASESRDWRGYGGGYGGEQGFENAGSWYEPYGEGQQYGSRQGSGGGFGQRDSGRHLFGQSGRMGQMGQYEQYGQRSQYGQSGQYGQHRGKGPKGYQRSDERLKELICERLRDDPEIDPSEVTVNVSGSRVTLDGSVDSRRTKNAIEDIVEQFDVTDVQNNLRVTKPFAQSGQGQGTQGSQGSQGEWGKTATGGRTAAGGGEDTESSTKQKRN